MSCQTKSGVCVELNAAGGQITPGTSGGAVAVASSVGINAVNLAADVKTVQDALNRIAPERGGAKPALKIDGLCGAKTKNAIQQFQIKQFGWSGADGKIDPGGQTITRMNQILGADGGTAAYAVQDTASTGSETGDQIFKAAMTEGLMRAQMLIRAAIVNLDAALLYVNAPSSPASPISSLNRETHLRLANRYFKIDDFPVVQKVFILQRVRQVYITMRGVFERPGGLWGERAFEIDSTGISYKSNEAIVAHTTGGGFFMGGEPSPHAAGMRADTIYFVRENIVWIAGKRNASGYILHELAHFCGEKDGQNWAIDDYDAYGQPDEGKVAALTPEKRIRHADSYARFAVACGD